MRIRLLILVGFLIITLQACIYRMDIPQGNQIDPQKLEQLKTGMTKSQVEFLLGSAAINDQYHANQAHYVYYLFNGKERTTELKKMILTYDADILVNIEGKL
ncbi:MAG: outer membrane protein assembly factor BamE, partial [Gammaproteobacteria bacterium]|jgi:outer membrane protein assembly factor BamE|nr:outer membrane protein assembly factor BamE [Gammaproteobacteria bacterium]MBT4451426.1 outer membrane protein assembly factor BamE [Gammaproteobacteria bacterium]MBT4862838.1 outer membrane protein assembly factor BamE [Gammaproteobacteria bacterium]MBT6456501.1 outer membrane protein assembly factor BamE [Gammaproteobacteria bacterium]MBT6552335.1 outer membrane protein assembly factor BamE [Gammaproteobacteria bacterium]